MGQSAWTFQDPKQIARHGAKKASWYVGWYDTNGNRRSKSCGPGSAGKKAAFRLARQIEADLIAGVYKDDAPKRWADFRSQYERDVLASKSHADKTEALKALKDFERIVKPSRVDKINTSHIDRFIAKRRKERGHKRGSTLSPATLNKQLRYLRAAFIKARKWKMLDEVPEFEFVREPSKLPRYVLPDHFADIYRVCDSATQPNYFPAFTAADWWRALLVFAHMTGWRIGAILAMKREDLDLEGKAVITRYADNKGKRDDRTPLHPVIVEHLQRIPHFGKLVFEWRGSEWQLYAHFTRLQQEAGIDLPCREDHEHTDACRVYGFHDLRRAFATSNADRLTGPELQNLMQHRSFSTTQRYINLANKMSATANKIHVPDFLSPKQIGGNLEGQNPDGVSKSS